VRLLRVMRLRHAVRSAATAAVVGSVGDVLMQMIERRNTLNAAPNGKQVPIDTTRTVRLATYRMFQAPFVDAVWRTFDERIPFGGAAGVIAKVVADQALLMPPSLVLFFLSQGAMEGLAAEQCVARVRASWLPSAMVCLPYWCVMHLFTFSVVPPNLRIAWSSTAAVGWNAALSMQNQLAIQREAECEPRDEPSKAGGESEVCQLEEPREKQTPFMLTKPGEEQTPRCSPGSTRLRRHHSC